MGICIKILKLYMLSQKMAYPSHYQGCPIFWSLWATLEKEELSWATH